MLLNDLLTNTPKIFKQEAFKHFVHKHTQSSHNSLNLEVRTHLSFFKLKFIKLMIQESSLKLSTYKWLNPNSKKVTYFWFKPKLNGNGFNAR